MWPFKKKKTDNLEKLAINVGVVPPRPIYILLNLFKKKITIEETIKAFPVWERALNVDLLKKFIDWNIAQGLPEETANAIAGQEVNYIKGEDWEMILQNATEEINIMVNSHKPEVVPSVTAVLKTDKMCREVIVNYLRIKSVLLFATLGNEHMESNAKKRIEDILLIYGPEFPEEADPVKFNKLMHNFHRTIFPEKR